MNIEAFIKTAKCGFSSGQVQLKKAEQKTWVQALEEKNIQIFARYYTNVSQRYTGH